MPYGPRVLGTGTVAEGDVLFADFTYNDATGSLTIGKPVFFDVTDAAQYNTVGSTGKDTVTRSNGKVVLSTNANAGRFKGIYDPQNTAEKPNKGDLIRVRVFGIGVASVQSPAAGNAGKVGTIVTASTAVTDLVPSATQASPTAAEQAGEAGVIVASPGVNATVAIGTQLIAAASATATLVNVSVRGAL